MNLRRCLIITIIILSLSHATYSADQNTLFNVHKLIMNLRNSIKENQQKNQDLHQQLKTAEIAIGDLSKQVIQLNRSLQDEETTLKTLKLEQEKYLKKLREENTTFAQQIRTTYLLGGAQQWKVILNQQDLNAINRHFTYYRYLSQSRLHLISDIKHTLTAFTNSIRSTHLHQQNLKKLLAEKQDQQLQQLRYVKARQDLIEKINERIRTKKQEMESLLANQKNLQDTLDNLPVDNSNFDSQSFAELETKLTWPVNGLITSSYGSLLDTGGHLNGVIIQTAIGTPVHAIYKGKIIFANWLRGFGLLVIIDHGNNYMSLYARNQAIYAEIGSFVNTGDVIAITGSSGGFTTPSLYFEIRHNGIPANPVRWCENEQSIRKKGLLT